MLYNISLYITVDVYDLSIGAGAQWTLGTQDIFARKYMYEQLTQFYMIFVWKKVNKMPEFYLIFTQTYFPEFWGQMPFATSPTPTNLSTIVSWTVAHVKYKQLFTSWTLASTNTFVVKRRTHERSCS